MAAINVNREVQDVFYRYKMPPIQAKVEGKGNGIKTVIPNMVDVAKALERPPSYTTKYFGCELGAQVQMDAKNERYIVNGAHDATRLQDLLDGFIKRFVLCRECNNPETKLRVTSKRQIEQKCIACGHRAPLDMTHKLTTFIVNNPPDGSDSKGAKGKLSKEERRAAKREGVELTSAARDNVRERAEGGEVEAPEIDESVRDEDIEWSEDTSDAAVRARAEQLGAGVAGLTMTDDLERTEEERLEMLAEFVRRVKDQSPLPDLDIFGEAERLDVKAKGVLPVTLELWDGKNLVPSIKNSRKVLLRFTQGHKKAQRTLLGAVEKYVDLHGDLLAQINGILKVLYDLDIVEEEAFLAWDEKGASSKYVKKALSGEIHDKAAKFITWLREAETESEDDDEEDDEDDEEEEDGLAVAFDSDATGVKVETDAAADGSQSGSEEDDDLDIDNI